LAFFRIKSSGLESALSLSPKHEQALFAARNCYDMVVIYDRASLTTPNSVPPSTSPEAQRVLWTLNSAIYEREFYKSLKRQPVLLKGGWEAWEKYVGAKGIVRDGEEAPGAVEAARRRPSLEESGQLEAKKAHRKASIVPGGFSGASLVKNPSDSVSGAPRSIRIRR
jgi:ubiquitin carboxyl-terminal hydrolase 8